jgi:hypothetical protein
MTKRDRDSKRAAALLSALAESNERLIAFKEQVRAHPEVVGAQHALELRGYDSGPVLEGYVDAELRSGHALAWWLDVHWGEEGWRVEASVRVDREEGEDILHVFPVRQATTLDDFISELNGAVADLIRSADEIDFASV